MQNMPTIYATITASGRPGSGTMSLPFSTTYDSKTNVTFITFGRCFISTGSIGGINSASLGIAVSATDKPENVEYSHFTRNDVGSTVLTQFPYPTEIYVQHGYKEVEKSISVSVSVSLVINGSNTNIIANGGSTLTLKTGDASIVNVGENSGTLYIYDKGEWRVGYLYGANGEKWNLGVGYIILDSEGLSISHDSNGNVTLSGLPASHDSAGNVVFAGVSATEDGNGNVTLS